MIIHIFGLIQIIIMSALPNMHAQGHELRAHITGKSQAPVVTANKYVTSLPSDEL